MIHYVGRLKDGVDPAALGTDWRCEVSDLEPFRPVDWLLPPLWLRQRLCFEPDWGTMLFLATDDDILALTGGGANTASPAAGERQFVAWVECY
jgi:hypothetical protein